jgi:hypothetical protein
MFKELQPAMVDNIIYIEKKEVTYKNSWLVADVHIFYLGI